MCNSAPYGTRYSTPNSRWSRFWTSVLFQQPWDSRRPPASPAPVRPGAASISACAWGSTPADALRAPCPSPGRAVASPAWASASPGGQPAAGGYGPPSLLSACLQVFIRRSIVLFPYGGSTPASMRPVAERLYYVYGGRGTCPGTPRYRRREEQSRTGTPVKRRGRKATGLRLSGHGGCATECLAPRPRWCCQVLSWLA